MPRHSRQWCHLRESPSRNAGRDAPQFAVRQCNDGSHCGRDGPDVSLRHAQWRTDVAQCHIHKGATALGLTTTASAIYAITGVARAAESCHDYRSPGRVNANQWTSSPIPIVTSGRRGVGIPLCPRRLRQRRVDLRTASRPAVIFYSRDGGRSFRRFLRPNWPA